MSFFLGGTKWWSLSVEGLLSTGPTPSSFYNSIAFSLLSLMITFLPTWIAKLSDSSVLSVSQFPPAIQLYFDIIKAMYKFHLTFLAYTMALSGASLQIPLWVVCWLGMIFRTCLIAQTIIKNIVSHRFRTFKILEDFQIASMVQKLSLFYRTKQLDCFPKKRGRWAVVDWVITVESVSPPPLSPAHHHYPHISPSPGYYPLVMHPTAGQSLLLNIPLDRRHYLMHQ